ncbi:MAG: universal stress protein, partial [Abditibacteriaceae bacterium]
MPALYRIICPLDFSPTSYEALKIARQLAQGMSSELILVHVIPFPTPNDQGFKSEEEAHRSACQNAENQLKEIIALRLRFLESTRFMVFSGSS